jgi:hypothetical protein
MKVPTDMKTKATLRKLVIIFFAGIAIGFPIAEIWLRLIGVTDFPVYHTDDEIGYVPMSNQSGAVMNTNRWVINDHNMNVGRDWDGSGTADVLVTGDSIVWGGNPLDDPDKLGARLQVQLPELVVWPVSAGSWSIENTCVWMQRNPDVIDDIEYCVWVLNSGDLQPGSKWSSDITHPRTRPISSLVYAADKYLYPIIANAFPSPSLTDHESMRVSAVDPTQKIKFAEQLKKLNAKKIKTVVVLYPDQGQRRGEESGLAMYDEFRRGVIETLPTEAKLIDLLDYIEWPVAYYRDGIHPSASGHDAMAKIIAAKIQSF